MSFDNNNKPLKLVDKNIINYYKQKIEKQTLTNNIKTEEIVVNSIKWYQCYLDLIKIYIKNYYGFILLFFIIGILLYYRYNEVNKKKKIIKKMLKKINNNNI
jgi:hypothetical protein